MPALHPLVQDAFATGEEISPIVEKIQDALSEVPRTHALIALTSLILLLQSPELDEQQLYNGVKDTSHFICTWLAGTDVSSSDEPIDKMKMN